MSTATLCRALGAINLVSRPRLVGSGRAGESLSGEASVSHKVGCFLVVVLLLSNLPCVGRQSQKEHRLDLDRDGRLGRKQCRRVLLREADTALLWEADPALLGEADPLFPPLAGFAAGGGV